MLDGSQLRILRRRHGWTQQVLAEAVGVYQPYISKLELGKHSEVSTHRLAALAAALGVPMERLVRKGRT